MKGEVASKEESPVPAELDVPKVSEFDAASEPEPSLHDGSSAIEKKLEVDPNVELIIAGGLRVGPMKGAAPEHCLGSAYSDFLARKALVDIPTGFDPGEDLHPALFPFQRDIVRWAIRRGRACLFEDCGLGKTIQQLVWADHVGRRAGKVLILTPLAVGRQTLREAAKFGILAQIAESQKQVSSNRNAPPIVITNYEKLHHFDPDAFAGVVLDESSILKAYDGKTRTAIIDTFRRTPFKLACTATPAPNDYTELGNHAEFVGAMTRAEMLSMFFVHDGGDTSQWRLKGHAQSDFWRWICSWAVNIRKPSDIGYSDDGFDLPPLKVHQHVVKSSHSMDGFLFALPASSLEERRNARKASLGDRVSCAARIANATEGPCLAWCNLNSESDALTHAIAGAHEVTGSQPDDEKADLMERFTTGEIQKLVTKPSIAGFGMNWQHCSQILFVGLSDSYEQFYQAVRRCWRFGQTRPVHAHIITSDIEGAVVSNILRKEQDAARMAGEMVKHMADITSSELHGTCRTATQYIPKLAMRIPEWLSA